MTGGERAGGRGRGEGQSAAGEKPSGRGVGAARAERNQLERWPTRGKAGTTQSRSTAELPATAAAGAAPHRAVTRATEQQEEPGKGDEREQQVAQQRHVVALLVALRHCRAAAGVMAMESGGRGAEEGSGASL